MTKISDYYPFSQYLLKQEALGLNLITVSFVEFEKIISRALPPTSRINKTWWSNSKTEKSRQCSAWLDYQWEKVEVDLVKKIVVFRKS
jgi:hypothetical protein